MSAPYHSPCQGRCRPRPDTQEGDSSAKQILFDRANCNNSCPTFHYLCGAQRLQGGSHGCAWRTLDLIPRGIDNATPLHVRHFKPSVCIHGSYLLPEEPYTTASAHLRQKIQDELMTQSASSLCSCISRLSPLSGIVPPCNSSGLAQGVRPIVGMRRMHRSESACHSQSGLQLCNVFGARVSLRQQCTLLRDYVEGLNSCILHVMISCALCLSFQSRLSSPGQCCNRLTRCSLDVAHDSKHVMCLRSAGFTAAP